MKILAQVFLKTTFLAVFLLAMCHTQETEERVCLENNLFPDDENENGTFNDFATLLENYSGLGKAPVTIELSCGTTKTSCVPNPNGTAIWEARMELYSNNMLSETNDSKFTLDGCLCYSADITEFEICMDKVRANMTEQLDTVLKVRFQEIVQQNCTYLVQENCI